MIQPQKFLTPIKPDPPAPHHTEIKPRCFTCQHFDVCSLKSDYLKTAQLIQNVLGNPCESKKITLPPFDIKGFEGDFILKSEDYFPECIEDSKNRKGYFYAAKEDGIDKISFLYIFEGYYVLFKAEYNSEESSYKVSDGTEICYKIQYFLKENQDLLTGLLKLREDFNVEEGQTKKEDIINTTYFSAMLDCQFYKWEKGLSYEDGVKNIIRTYPNGIKLKDNEIYHLVTFHKEKGKVPYFHPENGVPVIAPVSYPVFFPPKYEENCSCHKYTRDELNDEP